MKHINHYEMKNTGSFPIALIVSRFNEAVTAEMKQGALSRLEQLQFDHQDITLIEVPGAVEIPLIAKTLAKQGKNKAIICLGAVIRGETSHYDYVCSQVSEGCQAVMMEFELPVIFGVLTTENQQQAWDRLGGAHGHKAIDAVDAAIEMVEVMKSLA